MPTASSIVRSWVTRTSVPPKRLDGLLELLDRLEVEVVGGLVEHEDVDAANLQHRQRGAGALAGRQRLGGPLDVLGRQPELGQRRPSGGPVLDAGGGVEAGDERGRTREQVAPLADLAHDDAGPRPLRARDERQPAEERGQQRRLARAVAPDDGQPVAPRHLERHRTEPEAGVAVDPRALDDRVGQPGHDVAAPAGVRDREPQVPALPGLVDGLEPGQRLVGDLRLGGHVLGALHVAMADELVGLA